MNSIIRSGLRLRAVANASRIFSCRRFSTKQEVDSDQPLKFLGSDAQRFKAKENRVGYLDPDEIPWFQTYVVCGSVFVFMVYFFIFREENDIDAHLNKGLFETVPQLEKSTLIALYKYNLENDIDNTDVVKRLIEIGIDPLSIT